MPPGLSKRLAAAFCLSILSAADAGAQSLPATPWSVEAAHDRATATNQGVQSVWTTDRAQVGWQKPDFGGWFASAERQARGSRVDAAVAFRGYRRLGDWTVALGGGGTPDADFLSRVNVEGTVSRRVAGTLVASAGYRYLDFRTLDIHQAQPALTWYHAKGELEARLFVSRNTATGRTSPTFQMRTGYEFGPRIGVGGGFAYGDRIFDIASLPTGASRARAVFGTLRLGLTPRDSLVLGGLAAEEDPSFDYGSFSIGYRRTF